MKLKQSFARSLRQAGFDLPQSQPGGTPRLHNSLSLAVPISCLVLLACLLPLTVASHAGAAPEASDPAIGLDDGAFAGFVDVHTTDTRVLAIGPLMVSVEASGLGAYNAASLRIYTRNDAQLARSGMVGQSVPSETVPVKVWTRNFGDGHDNDHDGIPDVQDDRNWKSPTETVWVFVFDTAQPVSESVPPWDHPLFDYTDLFKWSNAHPNANYHLPSSGVLSLEQSIYVALDLQSKARPQVYSTTVYVEFALSDDYGETYTAHTASRSLYVSLNDAKPIVTLDVDTSEFGGFSALGPWPQRVMASDPLTLSLAAYGLYPYDAATLRVYTRNDPDHPGQIHTGMVGHLDRDKTVPIKVWTPNFGAGIDQDGDGIPDPDNNTNWRDPEKAVWVFAFDWNQPITETWWNALPPEHEYHDPNCAWCTPLFNYTDLYKWSDHHDKTDVYSDYVYHVPQYLELVDRRPQMGLDLRVPLYVAADLTDALPQTYSTTLYIEFALSSDGGETVTRNVVETVPISATVPGDGSPVNWLLNRVRMRPDLDGPEGSVKKLADSHQEAWDWSDGGWTYDQALAIIALTAAGHPEEARQLLNGLQYLQNDDGSWFFSYMTSATDEMIHTWATTDEATLYDGTNCLTVAEAISNGYPDELEKRVCWDEVHDDVLLDQIGPWLLEDNTSTLSPQTKTLLPNKIKYRTYDFRKYLGTNAWVVMAANFYELYTGDDSYRQMALGALDWITSYQNLDSNSPAYGGVAMGRVWRRDLVTETLETAYGFLDWDIHVAEHNFDAYSALRGMALLTGNTSYSEKAELIKSFVLRELWAPHVDTGLHPEVVPGNIDNYFFPGINMTEPLTPQGILDTDCIYLDGLSWSNLALGPRTRVLDKEGVSSTLEPALDYAEATMLVTDATIFTGTGYMVTGIDGFKESTCSPDLVWSEGSEGMVAAYYVAGGAENQAKADYYHAETASYMMPNGGVPYSNKPPKPSDPYWNWTDANSIAGTAWFLFSEPWPRLNPFQPRTTRYVAKSGIDEGECLDRDEPCLTVQFAVDAAVEGDVVKVAAGQYDSVQARAVPPDYNNPPASGTITQVVYLSKTLSIQGGYTTTNWTEPDPETYQTTLDAQDRGRVLFIHGAISPTIEGLRITGGNADQLGGGNERHHGGGVFVIDAAPTFRRAEVISNTAGYTGFGGGIYFSFCPDVTLTQSTIRDNTAWQVGGLYFDRSPRATLIDSDISENVAHRPGGLMKPFGGIRFSHSDDAVLIGNTITGNQAANRCGGVCFDGGNNALLQGNEITDNSSGSHGFGPGSHGGGLLFSSSSGARLVGNRIVNNHTYGHGGGIYQEMSDVILINNVIADNVVIASGTFTPSGSALYLRGESIRMLHNTIARNSGGDGSGIYITDKLGSFCTAELTNTIIATHAVGISITAGSKAIVDGILWWDNGENTQGDGPITVTHAYTGNPRFVDPDGGNYHIGPGSAAIDRGVDSGVTTDIDGEPRPGCSGYDLGADEYGWYVYLPLIMRNAP